MLKKCGTPFLNRKTQLLFYFSLQSVGYNRKLTITQNFIKICYSQMTLICDITNQSLSWVQGAVVKKTNFFLI